MFYLLFILICYGITQILVDGKIFDKIRPKHHYFHCSMCVGVPVGIIVFFIFWICRIKLFPSLSIGLILFGFLSSATSYVLCKMFGEGGINIKIN